MAGFALTLNTEQRQVLSQKMIQSATILEMAAQELEAYLAEQEMENPVLELERREVEERDREQMEKLRWLRTHDEQNRYLYSRQAAEKEQSPAWERGTDAGETLAEHLWEQLMYRSYTEEELRVLRYICHSLDGDGYFREGVAQLAERFAIPEERAAALLEEIRTLEPAGVGAHDLADCLALQIRAAGQLTKPLERLVRNHLEDLARNRMRELSKALGLSLEETLRACELVRSLDPKPGAAYGQATELPYIIPDVLVVWRNGALELHLNETLYPEIGANLYYVSLCEQTKDGEVRAYLLDKIRRVEWLRECVSRRNTTLLAVTEELLRRQEAFFWEGPTALGPLSLAEVAQALGVHESTVSRAVREKYLQCAFGVFPMSHFFARAQTGAAGERVATQEVWRELRALIDGEDRKKPYSDQTLVKLLEEKGYVLSRRTVAKYREILCIPGSSVRKEYGV